MVEPAVSIDILNLRAVIRDVQGFEPDASDQPYAVHLAFPSNRLIVMTAMARALDLSCEAGVAFTRTAGPAGFVWTLVTFPDDALGATSSVLPYRSGLDFQAPEAGVTDEEGSLECVESGYLMVPEYPCTDLCEALYLAALQVEKYRQRK